MEALPICIDHDHKTIIGKLELIENEWIMSFNDYYPQAALPNVGFSPIDSKRVNNGSTHYKKIKVYEMSVGNFDIAIENNPNP